MKKLIRSVLPDLVKRNLLTMVKTEVKTRLLEIDAGTPKFELERNHLVHLGALPNRRDLLNKRPKETGIEELGADNGELSSIILQHCEPEKLHLIDIWTTDRCNKGKQKSVVRKFQYQIADSTVELHI